MSPCRRSSPALVQSWHLSLLECFRQTRDPKRSKACTLSTTNGPLRLLCSSLPFRHLGNSDQLNDLYNDDRLSFHAFKYPPLLAELGAHLPILLCYDTCAPSFSNPPAFLMARRISPSVRWSGLSLRSRIMAATSRPCLDTSLCRNFISPLRGILGTGAITTSDSASKNE
jgi:hypothetical protein